MAWFDQNAADLPWRREPTPYRVLVSEFMLQQTQRARVAPKFVEFLDRFPTVESLAAAPLSDVIRAWAGLGYNGRAVRLHRLARTLVESGAGMPSQVERLRALPGVGEYTARAIACFGFGAQEWVVDTNVSRVLRRTVAGEPYPKPRHGLDSRLASEALPAGQAYAWNSGLMDLGATVCLAQAPRCVRCPLAEVCAARPQIALARTEGRPADRRVAEHPASYATTGRPHRGGSFTNS
ncbi:MAG TPA: A/G-specific adenine glycosylase, partial [Dehalococcoidia bacterium]|nr:A/G-specific adenine glycosylase [Dehalococcoidia bacterium]